MILELIALAYVTYLMLVLMLMSLCKPALNVPCQGQSSTYASTNKASEENALPLLASAATLLSDNSTEY